MNTYVSAPTLPWTSDKEYITISIPEVESLEQEKEEKNIDNHKRGAVFRSPYALFSLSGDNVPPWEERVNRMSTLRKNDEILGVTASRYVHVLVSTLHLPIYWCPSILNLWVYIGFSGFQVFEMMLWACVLSGYLATVLAWIQFKEKGMLVLNGYPSVRGDEGSGSLEILLEHAIKNLRRPREFLRNRYTDDLDSESFALSLANPSHLLANRFSLPAIRLESFSWHIRLFAATSGLGSLYLGFFNSNLPCTA
jgi:hypothetical protein